MNADPRHQILGILSFSDRERTLPPSTEISVLTFVMGKRKEGFDLLKVNMESQLPLRWWRRPGRSPYFLVTPC